MRKTSTTDLFPYPALLPFGLSIVYACSKLRIDKLSWLVLCTYSIFRYIAEKALEDVEAARQRQEAVVDAARAAAEQAAREADEEAAKQAAALAEATAAFKALAASKEAEDEAAARASRSNSVKKSRGFFRRGSKAPSRDPSVGREEAPAGGKQRGKSLSRRESKDKSSKRPSVVADAPGATAAASGNSSGATKGRKIKALSRAVLTCYGTRRERAKQTRARG